MGGVIPKEVASLSRGRVVGGEEKQRKSRSIRSTEKTVTCAVTNNTAYAVTNNTAYAVPNNTAYAVPNNTAYAVTNNTSSLRITRWRITHWRTASPSWRIKPHDPSDQLTSYSAG